MIRNPRSRSSRSSRWRSPGTGVSSLAPTCRLWKASSGQGWTIPVGLDVGKVFKIGNRSMSLQLGAYYNATKPAGTADWFLQTQVTLIY